MLLFLVLMVILAKVSLLQLIEWSPSRGGGQFKSHNTLPDSRRSTNQIGLVRFRHMASKERVWEFSFHALRRGQSKVTTWQALGLTDYWSEQLTSQCQVGQCGISRNKQFVLLLFEGSIDEWIDRFRVFLFRRCWWWICYLLAPFTVLSFALLAILS